MSIPSTIMGGYDMGVENIGWLVWVTGIGMLTWLGSLLPVFGRRHDYADRQPAHVERWRLLSDEVLAQIIGRREPMGRAEAVLRLRLQGYEGFPSSPYDDRKWTHLYRYVGLLYVEVSISDAGMDLRWQPSLMPGGDFLYAGFAVEGWVEEQDCLDGLAAIAALNPDLSRSLVGITASGVPIALGVAALDAFSEVVPRIFADCIDLSEVAAEARVADAVETATKGLG